jgi:hypothetical protein
LTRAIAIRKKAEIEQRHPIGVLVNARKKVVGMAL